MIEPVWGRVLVLPDDIAETDPLLQKAKEMGFELPDKDLKREQFAQMEGTLIGFGGNAFENWKGDIPKNGHRVIFDKHAGCTKEYCGKTYRLINDTDIIAVIQV